MRRINVIGLTQEQQDQYIRELYNLNSQQMRLAQFLMQITFPEREFEENFIPAPLYVSQAHELTHGGRIPELLRIVTNIMEKT